MTNFAIIVSETRVLSHLAKDYGAGPIVDSSALGKSQARRCERWRAMKALGFLLVLMNTVQRVDGQGHDGKT